MISRNPRPRRKGAIVLLSAFLLIFLLAMVAFAVDIAWIVLTKDQLQNAADSAALAAADPLMDAYVQYQLAPAGGTQTTILNNALSSARTNAKNYANFNQGGDVKNLTLNDADIEFGFTDAAGNYTSSYSGFPNTVKVTIRRDSSANGSLALFFAPVLGKSSQDLTATASATIEGGTINNFSLTGSQSVSMLPMTYDVDNWTNFLKTGLDPDGNKTTAANGLAELQVYPSVKAPGNFGQLSLDDSHVGESTEASWVNSGMRATDLAALQSAKLLPLSQHDTTKWDWQGDTGMKASLVMTINNYTNKIFALPLFQAYSSVSHTQLMPKVDNGLRYAFGPKSPFENIQLVSRDSSLLHLQSLVLSTNNNGNGNGNGNGSSSSSYSAGTGQGSNYFYQIVQFVGVKIMPTSDNNGQVVVQPAAYMTPYATMTNVQPAGTQSRLVTTFATPKLSH